MIITPEKFKYKVKVLQGTGTLADITGAITDISLEDDDGEIAQHADVTVANIKCGSGNLSDMIKPGCSLFYYADWGAGFTEVFRGFVWDWNDRPTSSDKSFEFTAYDNLIFLDKSQDNLYFSKDTKTESIISAIAKKWNVPLSYQYKSIAHSKQMMPATTLSDALKTILDDAQSKLDEDYVVTSQKGVLTIAVQGSNSTVCEFNADNCTATQNKLSMDDLITKVVVGGKEDSEGRIPVEVIFEGRTEFGVLQSITNRDGDTTLAAAETEAKKTLQEHGNLSEDRTIDTIDIPFIRKGDKIKVSVGSLDGYFYVLGVTHSPKTQTMTLQIKSASPAAVPVKAGKK
jgi:hypothetical protein